MGSFASGWASCRSTASLTLRAICALLQASFWRDRIFQGGHRKGVMALVAVAGVAPPAASAPDDHRHMGKTLCVLVLEKCFPQLRVMVLPVGLESPDQLTSTT